MNIFLMQFRNELFKLMKHKKFVVLLIIEVILCLISGGTAFLMGRYSEQIVAVNFTLLSMSLNLLGFFIQGYIPLIIIMNACDLFNTEFNDLTIKASFMRPISRFKIYFAKVMALFTVATIYLFALFVTTTVIQVFSKIFIIGSKVSSRDHFIRDFFIYFVDLVPMFILVLFIAMLMQIFKGNTLSILISIVIYVGINIFSLIKPHIGIMIFTNYMQWHKLFFGVVIPFGALFFKFFLLSGYLLIFACVGYYLFERREL